MPLRAEMPASVMKPIIEAIESGRETLELENLFNTRHGTYVLRVKGNSMIEDHIADGDYVIIERREVDLPRPRELEVTYGDAFSHIVQDLRERIGRVRK